MPPELHIIPHTHTIDAARRGQQHGQRALVVWFTGLSGSGKSTLANRVEQQLFAEGRHTYLLDGDNVRTGLNADLTFSAADRTENIRRIGEVARLMVDAGLVVLTAFISPFQADRDRIRQRLAPGAFVEVFVDCPLEVCEQRDVKGLYAKARRGEIPDFTGISSPFEAPVAPELVVRTHAHALEVCAAQVCDYLRPRLTWPANP